jgi:hypothetical protein
MMIKYQCRSCGHISSGHSHPLALKSYRSHKANVHPGQWLRMPRRLDL